MLENSLEQHKRLPRKKRELSIFMAQEMLYDYATNRLDADRHNSLKEMLAQNAELKNEYETLLIGDKYAEHLSQTRISEKLTQELNEVMPMSHAILKKMRWQNWPQPMRWSTEALAISIFVATLAILIPWQKLDIQLFSSRPDVALYEAKEKPVVEPSETTIPQNVQEIKSAIAEREKVAEDNLIKQKAPEVPTSENMTASKNKPNEVKVAAIDEEVNTRGQKKRGVIEQPKGQLINFMMNLDPSQSLTADIRQIIVSAGGKKAGQVELGWRKRNPDGSYYHFTLPESNYQQVINQLGGYGPIRIYKNPHDRVMPEGVVRIILWVEDKAKPNIQKNNAERAAPSKSESSAVSMPAENKASPAATPEAK